MGTRGLFAISGESNAFTPSFWHREAHFFNPLISAFSGRSKEVDKFTRHPLYFWHLWNRSYPSRKLRLLLDKQIGDSDFSLWAK